MPAALLFGDYILVRGTDMMSYYMMEEGYLIWTRTVSYFKKN